MAFTPSLEEDLKRRDFTINAMAFNRSEGLVDLFEGREDLRRELSAVWEILWSGSKRTPCAFSARFAFPLSWDLRLRRKQAVLSGRWLHPGKGQPGTGADRAHQAPSERSPGADSACLRDGSRALCVPGIFAGRDAWDVKHPPDTLGHRIPHSVPMVKHLRWAAFLARLGRPLRFRS